MRLVLNHAMLALAISLGRRTRLFETMARLPPSTSGRIAEAAGLDERYVREWLGAMVTGRVVDYDGARGTYALPAEHAAVLTDVAGADDMALAMQSVPALGRVEERVAACFRSGAGLPPEVYQEWRGLRDEEIARRHRAILLDEVLPLVPGLVERLRAGIDVLHLACCGGDAPALMKTAFPASRIVGHDPAALVHTAAFDLVTAFDCVHEQPQPARLLSAVFAALRP